MNEENEKNLILKKARQIFFFNFWNVLFVQWFIIASWNFYQIVEQIISFHLIENGIYEEGLNFVPRVSNGGPFMWVLAYFRYPPVYFTSI